MTLIKVKAGFGGQIKERTERPTTQEFHPDDRTSLFWLSFFLKWPYI